MYLTWIGLNLVGQAILCYYNTFNPPTRLTSMYYSHVGSNGKCSLVWDCCPAEGAVIHLNYTGMSVYLHFKMFMGWSSLSANNSASSNRIGRNIWSFHFPSGLSPGCFWNLETPLLCFSDTYYSITLQCLCVWIWHAPPGQHCSF